MFDRIRYALLLATMCLVFLSFNNAVEMETFDDTVSKQLTMFFSEEFFHCRVSDRVCTVVDTMILWPTLRLICTNRLSAD